MTVPALAAELPSEAEPVGSDSGGTGSPLRAAVRRLRRKPVAIVCAVVIVLLALMAVFAPALTALNGHSPSATYPNTLNPMLGGLPNGPFGGVSSSFWFGVEPSTGRDLFSEVVYGARVSLFISVSATLVTVVVAVAVGIAAGYFGGWVDAVIGRVMDVLIAFPSLIFMIALVAVLPTFPRIPLLVIIMSAFNWPYLARIVRGQTISLREREFVEAALSLGASTRAILFRELLPNLTAPILVTTTLMVPSYIGYEAGLSFLGLGVPPGTPSWGSMIASSLSWYSTDPMYVIVPGAFLFLTVVSFNLLGDALQAALDPRRLS